MNPLSHAPRRTLTELDHVRIARLLERLDAARVPQPLQDVLDDARQVPSREVSPDVVTMYSRIDVVAAGDAVRRRLTLCYPPDAEPAAGFVSVLSPIGCALLGRRVGERVSWRTPAGHESVGEIAAILFQPEASGDYTT